MVRIEHVIDHSILTDAVPLNGAVVFDCGANQGAFAEWAVDRFNASVYSFEADPILAERLPKRKGIEFFNIAVAGRDGQMTLRRVHDRCTSGVFNTQAEPGDTFRVAARSLESFCAEHRIACIDLLKLDIEGAELDVLEQASPDFLATVRQITCEFHDFLDSEQVPRIEAVIRRMKRLGFAVIRMSFWTYGDMLMVNQAASPLGPLARVWIGIHKYAAGIVRMIRRRRAQA
jgi:FkbM family methyltransferase